MQKRILALVLVLIIGLTVSVFGGYGDKLSSIFNKEGELFGAFAKDLSKYSNGEIGFDKMVEKTKVYKREFKSNLQKLIMLEEDSDSQDLHTQLVSVLSGYYLAVDIFLDGLQNNDPGQIDLANQFLRQVTMKLSRLSWR